MIDKCGGESSIQQNSIFLNNAFIKSGMTSGIFGAYFGIIIDSIYLGGTKSDINDTPIWKGVLRALVCGAVASPFLLLYFLVSNRMNAMAVYIVKSTLPFFFIMLLLFSIVKPLLMKLKLLNTSRLS